MANLATANLMHRKTRTAVSVTAVALQVATVMLLIGLANGTLGAIGERLQSVGADVILQPPDASLILGATQAVMPERLMDLIREVPGVRAVTPVLNWHVSQLKGSPESLNLWAIDSGSFATLSGGLDLVAGHGLAAEGDLVVDTLLAASRSLRVGEVLHLLNRDFRVAGISRAGSGGRIYARLEDIQQAVGTPGRASFFLVKGRTARDAAELAGALEGRFAGYKITPIAQVSKALQDNAVGLTQFKRALTALSVVASFLVVLLAMYTAILERTREIGILRAMGATQAWVLRLVMIESAWVCIGGVVAGFGLAVAGRLALLHLFPAEEILLTAQWAARAAALGLVGGLIGSLYPALLAARLDPVRALTFE